MCCSVSNTWKHAKSRRPLEFSILIAFHFLVTWCSGESTCIFLFFFATFGCALHIFTAVGRGDPYWDPFVTGRGLVLCHRPWPQVSINLAGSNGRIRVGDCVFFVQ